ncbi:MAG: AAA family ATPase [Candidatus Cloacimonadaceae bacterium]
MIKKAQRDMLGITQIYELIQPPSHFLAGIKRQQLGTAQKNLLKLSDSYQRVNAMLKAFKQDEYDFWPEYLDEIVPFEVSEKSQLSLPDFFELKKYLFHYIELRNYVIKHNLTGYPLPDAGALFKLLDPEGNGLPVFRLSPLFSPRLAEIDKERQALNLKLKHERHAYLQEARKVLEMDNLKEVFCLSRSEHVLIHKLTQTPYFLRQSENVANITYSLADSEKSNELKAQIASQNEALEAEEERILKELSNKVKAEIPLLKAIMQDCADIGWDYMLAAFARDYDCCIPTLQNKPEKLSFKAARNLPLQLALAKEERSYQSLDIFFEAGANLITGPNMGGKTSILKCIAQMAELLRHGIPLPAREASLPLYDFIYYNSEGESDNLSSFGAEVVALNKALENKGHGLYILDEFARGTNPSEGELLATAVIRHLAKTPHTLIAATHYAKPARIEEIAHFHIKGIAADFDAKINPESRLEQRLKLLASAMDYSLVKEDSGTQPPMDAIRIAKILGLPEEIFSRIESEIE